MCKIWLILSVGHDSQWISILPKGRFVPQLKNGWILDASSDSSVVSWKMKVLISILIYIFAILLTRTVGFPHKEANPEIDRYFGNILYSGTAQDKSWNRRFPVLGLRNPKKWHHKELHCDGWPNHKLTVKRQYTLQSQCFPPTPFLPNIPKWNLKSWSFFLFNVLTWNTVFWYPCHLPWVPSKKRTSRFQNWHGYFLGVDFGLKPPPRAVAHCHG